MNPKIDADAVTALYALENRFNNLPMLKKSDLSPNDLLVVVDMINGFCRTGALKSDRCLALADSMKKTVESCGLKKVFVCDKHTRNSQELSVFPEHCTDNLEIMVIDELIDFAENVVYKNSTNAFFQFMQDIQIDKETDCVIMVGVCTDICLLQFALTLKAFFNELNYPVDVAVLTDLCETYDADGHSADLFNLMSLALLEENGVKLYRNIE